MHLDAKVRRRNMGDNRRRRAAAAPSRPTGYQHHRKREIHLRTGAIVRRAARTALALAGIVLAATSAIMIVQTGHAEQGYRQMGERIEPVQDKQSRWNDILRANSETVGWLKVDGTPIDYPIVQPAGSTAKDFYLSHDFWKRADIGGCPYLDARTRVGARHLLVFGHRLGMTDRMFSSLGRAWDEERFSSIGTASLSAPNRVTEYFDPICAIKVDQDFPDIQRFDFEDGTSFRSWLRGIAGKADARRKEAESRIERAERVLTLVTCAGNRSGGRERTLVIFYSDDQTGLAGIE